MKTKIFYWILRIVPAIILLQTLYFKFSAAPESVFIFSTLGVEPYGRIGLGVIELITAILILIPKTAFYGTLTALALMVGAIFSHLFVLGIVVQNDGGTLFILALLTFCCCGLYLLLKKNHPKS
ncbi:DoxX family protein [Maribacter litoralis]|uniref:DoxX family protein n=1 Tax=Maribacter litoralis TaxID=2059726 RepID=UPI003F5CF1D2